MQVLNNPITSAVQLAKCILLHAYYLLITARAPSCASTNKNFIKYSYFWLYGILRTD